MHQVFDNPMLEPPGFSSTIQKFERASDCSSIEVFVGRVAKGIAHAVTGYEACGLGVLDCTESVFVEVAVGENDLGVIRRFYCCRRFGEQRLVHFNGIGIGGAARQLEFALKV